MRSSAARVVSVTDLVADVAGAIAGLGATTLALARRAGA
jgi:hypothetical protein